MSFAYATPRIEAQLSVGVWTSLATDLSAAESFVWSRGMSGGGPLDNVASPGTCTFGLKNWDAGARRDGWYSPNHANVRAGWAYGIPIRVVVAYLGTDYVRWTGKLRAIDPVPGLYRERRVRCLALDCMTDLAENDVREITPQVDQTENDLVQSVIDAMPTAAQPVAVDYDDSLDTYPYALDDASSGTKALTLIARVLNSARAFGYPLADGTFKVSNRQARPVAESSYTFTDAVLDSVSVPSDLGIAFNRVRTTTHPRTVDAAATTVLFAMTARQAVTAGASITVWGDYTAADNSLKLIGGTAQVTPIVATTDYTATSAADGSGSSLTANISVVTTAFAAAVKFVITNNGGSTAYVLCQIRGKGIYDNAPISFEATSAQDYGDRLLDVDLPYQDDGSVAQALADFLVAQYAEPSDQVFGFAFNPQKSHALMLQALTTEIGDVKTITEAMTGATDVDVVIQAIDEECTPGGLLRARYLTAPKGPTNTFIWDESLWDAAETVWGYA